MIANTITPLLQQEVLTLMQGWNCHSQTVFRVVMVVKVPKVVVLDSPFERKRLMEGFGPLLPIRGIMSPLWVRFWIKAARPARLRRALKCPGGDDHQV